MAVEVLMNGLPSGIPAAAPATAPSGSPGGAEMTLDGLRQHPQFPQLRALVQRDPSALQQVRQ
jgi:hypothetical protein